MQSSSGRYKYLFMYLPDDALIVRNMYVVSFLFVFYCETYTKDIPRKVYLQCFTFHHHPRQSIIDLFYYIFILYYNSLVYLKHVSGPMKLFLVCTAY